MPHVSLLGHPPDERHSSVLPAVPGLRLSLFRPGHQVGIHRDGREKSCRQEGCRGDPSIYYEINISWKSVVEFTHSIFILLMIYFRKMGEFCRRILMKFTTFILTVIFTHCCFYHRFFTTFYSVLAFGISLENIFKNNKIVVANLFFPLTLGCSLSIHGFLYFSSLEFF